MKHYRIAWGKLSGLLAADSYGSQMISAADIKAGCEWAMREFEGLCGVRFGKKGSTLTISVKKAAEGKNGRAYAGKNYFYFNSRIGSKTKASRWTGWAQIRALARHELGHILGLKHSKDKTSPMHPNAGQSAKFTAAEIAFLRKKYPLDKPTPVASKSVADYIDEIRSALDAIERLV